MDTKQKTWSLTALAAEFDLPFKTAMSYRKGYTHIPPDVKVKGEGKLQYSPKQAAKFLAARILFRDSFPKNAVQSFFSEVMDEYDIDGLLFSDPINTNDLREELLAALWLVTVNPATDEHYFIICKGENEKKFRDLVQSVFDAEWKFTVLSLGVVRDELWNRVQANYRCQEYKPKSAGQRVKEALDAYCVNR